MPTHDHAPRRSSVEIVRRAQERTLIQRLAAQIKARKRKRPGGGEAGGEPVPVEPNRPDNLTGGGAAALEFDD